MSELKKHIDSHITSIQDVSKLDCSFIGYYWMSDSQEPVKINGKISEHKDSKIDKRNPFTEITSNPYIVEGNLYCRENKLSISIKNTGEGAIVRAINVSENETDGLKFSKQNYIAHRLDGVKKVKFIQAWEAKADNNCEGMEVLQPAWRAFVGFDVETKKQEEE